MTTSTCYSSVDDGTVWSYDATYATAREGASQTAGPSISVGQDNQFLIYEGFLDLDTSVVGTDDVSAATLSLWLISDFSTTDFTVQARLYDWGAGAVASGDWVAGSALAGYTLLATRASSGIGATGAYKEFTSEAAFPANINKTGETRLILHSDRHSGANQPTNDEYMTFQDADYAGTTRDPKLVVVHAAAPAGHGPSPALVLQAVQRSAVM